MKTVSALAALIGLGFASTAFAQLATLPADSTIDGNAPQSEGLNSGPSHWDSNSGIHDYNVSSNDTVRVPGTPDSYLGLNWANSQPSEIQSGLATINAGGGTVRAIYVGETAGWLNDFGYTYDKSPVTDSADSFTVWHNIQSTGTPTVNFGDHIDVSLTPKEEANFDFWLNGSGNFDTTKGPNSTGGVYTIFNPSNSVPYDAPGNVMWAQSPLMESTWSTVTMSYIDVPTYLVSFEDERLDQTDADYSDLILAIQLFDANGTPLGGNTPVPEASTYGLVGAAGLLGLAAWRRRKVAVQAAV